jgi:valyl-tRNA synthetase
VLHPLVRGSDGRKMSKSLGNVIDPCDLMEGRALSDLLARLKTSNLDAKQMTSAESLMKKDYPQGMKPCGADALRLALVSRVNLDEYITLDYKKVLACRQLANKIWQCARFVRPHTDQNAINEFVGGSAQSNASSNQIWEAAISPASVTKSYSQLDSSQRWILFHLYECVAACNAHMHALQWRAAAEHLQTFFVSRLCDVYLEFSKTTLASSDLQQRNNARAVLLLCFETFLRLLHPIMPYLTEELWHRLPAAVRSSTASSISLASYPLTHQYACFAAPSVKHASTVPQCFDTKAVEQQASSIQTDKAVQASVSEFDLILSVLDAFRAQKASIAAKSVIANITVTVASSESQRTVLEFEQHLAFLTRAKCMMVNVDTALTGAPTVKIGTEASVPL